MPAWPLVVLLAVGIVTLVVACNEGGPADKDRATGTKSYKAIVIQYQGRPLHCIERRGTTGIDTTSGAYSGLTCDFVAFHQEGG